MSMIYLVTDDIELKQQVESIAELISEESITFDPTKESCEILSELCAVPPSIALIDDDSKNFDSKKLIPSIRNLCPNMALIFLTSDSSIDKGSRIAQHNIQYYGIKPVSQSELKEVLLSLLNRNNSNYQKQGVQK